jgi:hypothetical protein
MPCASAILSRWPVLFYKIFPHYLINSTIKKTVEHKICVLILSATFIWNVFPSRKNWAKYDKKYVGSSRTVPVILVRFEWNLNFLVTFSQNAHMSNFVKIRPVGAEFLHEDGRTDGRTDIWKANSSSPQFCERAYKVTCLLIKNIYDFFLCVLYVGTSTKK